MGFVNILLVTQAVRHVARRPAARGADPARDRCGDRRDQRRADRAAALPAGDRDARHVLRPLGRRTSSWCPNPVTASDATGRTRWPGRSGRSPAPCSRSACRCCCGSRLRRTAFVESLLAVGDHDATAFSAGVNVNAVRISAYALGGTIAGDRRHRARRPRPVGRRPGVHGLHSRRAGRRRARRDEPGRRPRRPAAARVRRGLHLPAREPAHRLHASA